MLAEEPAQAAIETQPEAPKSTQETAKETANTEVSDDAAGEVIAFAGRIKEADTAETPATARANDLVTVRAKPEKRKSYKERAKAKFAKKDDKEDDKDLTEVGTTPDTTATAKSKVRDEAMEKAKAEKRAKAKVERQKAKEQRKASRSKAKKSKAA